MVEFALTFVFLLLMVGIMAIGVLSGRHPITGSCGGLNNLGVDGACEICGGDMSKCENASPEELASATSPVAQTSNSQSPVVTFDPR
ncbi:MAG: (Na+)-NQR maturation NqrM [Pseudomonadales bacterium]|nr:(Na+)-NQR maturation NqrM [Pseudomonadales bacterium]